MTARREPVTVPAMASISEAEYRAAIAGGMTICAPEVKRDTQRRIRAVAAAKGGQS